MKEIRNGQKIEAIRQLREETGLDLKEAKIIIDRETALHQASHPNNFPELTSSRLSRLKSSSPLSQALAEISHWIDTSKSSHAQNIHQNRAPRLGLAREEIDRNLKDINFCPSEEVYELYQWHDGRIILGDYANPVFFLRLKEAVSCMVNLKVLKLPIFVGDEIYYVVDCATDAQISSPIHCYDQYDSSEFTINTNAYAPSITSLMQAIVECIKNYDGISAHYMAGDKNLPLAQSSETRDDYRFYKSLLDPIYARYGIRSLDGSKGGLWR